MILTRLRATPVLEQLERIVAEGGRSVDGAAAPAEAVESPTG